VPDALGPLVGGAPGAAPREAGIALVVAGDLGRPLLARIDNFNEDGFDALYPRYGGAVLLPSRWPSAGRSRGIGLSRPADHGQPFSTWRLSKLAEFLVAAGVVDDISHEGLRQVLIDEGVSLQAIKNRVLELYDMAEGRAAPGPDDPAVVFSMDEFGPLNLLPRPGKQWVAKISRHDEGDPRLPRRRRRRATYKRTQGVRHLLAALNMNQDKLYGHIKTNKTRTTFLDFCRYVRSLYPPEVRIAIVLDNYGRHLSTNTDDRVGRWAQANNVELAYVPTHASFLKSHRVPLHRVELLRAGRHRPSQPRRAELSHSALHRLAQPQQKPSGTSCPFNARQVCLTRH
jgi:DDE superfamily endonuclease